MKLPGPKSYGAGSLCRQDPSDNEDFGTWATQLPGMDIKVSPVEYSSGGKKTL